MIGATRRPEPARTIRESLKEYGRGVAGGLLFSLPLLYTMEMWSFGASAHPARLGVYVLATIVLLLAYNYFAGLRHDSSWSEVAIDSVEEIGLGLVISAGVLVLLERVSFDMPASEVVGRVVLTAMTVAIGVSIGTAQLGGQRDESDAEGMRGEGDEEDVPSLGHHIVLAFIGALLIGANIAPTEEVFLLGAQVAARSLMGLIAASLALALVILFFSEFRGAHGLGEDAVVFVLRRTVITYVVALAAAAAALWFFDGYGGVTLSNALAQTVVLGAATTLGASAGKLLIQ